MSFNGSGTYVPPLGVPVSAGTVIQSAVFNAFVADVGNTFNNVLTRDGQAPMTSQFKVVDGTSSSPGVAFNGEASTGMYRPGTGLLGLVTNGVEVLRLNSAGRLMVNTTTDDTVNALQVNGSAKISGAVSAASTLAVTGTGTFTGAVTANGGVTSTTVNATGAATLGSTLAVTGASTLTGSVGIGAANATAQKLVVTAPPGNAQIAATDGNVTQLVGYTAGSGAGGIAYTGTSTNHVLGLITNNIERARIDTLGNFVVGQGAANAAVAVNGGTTGATGGASVVVQNGGTYRVAIGNKSALVGNAYSNEAWVMGNSELVLAVSGTERVRVDGSGNLLVGTSTAPAYGAKLRVQGGIESHGSQQFNVAPSNSNPFEIVNRAGGGFDFYPSGSTWGARLTTTGLGIGGAPVTKLDVHQAGSGVTPLRVTNGTRSGYLYLDTTGTGFTDSADNTFVNGVYLRGNTNEIDLYTSGTRKLKLTEQGNLLVGDSTTTPWTAANRGIVSVNGAVSTLYGMTIGGTSAAYLYHDGTHLNLNNERNGSLVFATNQQVRGRFDSNGNFSVKGMGRFGGWYDSATTNEPYDAAVEVGMSGTSGYVHAFNRTAGTYRDLNFVGAAVNVTTNNGGKFTINGTEVGFRGVPVNTVAGYATGHPGFRGCVYVQTAASGVEGGSGFAAGDVIMFINNTAGAITLFQTSGTTLRLAGTTATGNRTLAPRAMASILWISGTEAYVSGAGVS